MMENKDRPDEGYREEEAEAETSRFIHDSPETCVKQICYSADNKEHANNRENFLDELVDQGYLGVCHIEWDKMLNMKSVLLFKPLQTQSLFKVSFSFPIIYCALFFHVISTILPNLVY